MGKKRTKDQAERAGRSADITVKKLEAVCRVVIGTAMMTVINIMPAIVNILRVIALRSYHFVIVAWRAKRQNHAA
jgi:hypothetical protein